MPLRLSTFLVLPSTSTETQNAHLAPWIERWTCADARCASCVIGHATCAVRRVLPFDACGLGHPLTQGQPPLSSPRPPFLATLAAVTRVGQAAAPEEGAHTPGEAVAHLVAVAQHVNRTRRVGLGFGLGQARMVVAAVHRVVTSEVRHAPRHEPHHEGAA